MASGGPIGKAITGIQGGPDFGGTLLTGGLGAPAPTVTNKTLLGA